jgi:lipopolysaccharide biosynthesis regulator YciM
MLAVSPALTAQNASVNKLIQATQIETSRIYEAAKPSELAQAFNEILRRPNAKDELVQIFQQAKTDAGRIYALTGLHSVDTNEYRVRIAQVPADNAVKAMWYCEVRIFAVKDLAKMIESGELDGILRRR